MKKILRLVFTLGVLLFACWANAQDNPNLEIGFKPYGSYQGGNIDVVNLLNGNLSIYQSLEHFPQRGGKLDFDYRLQYNNKSWFINEFCDPAIGCSDTWNLTSDNSQSVAPGGVGVVSPFQMTTSGHATVLGCDVGGGTCIFDWTNTVTTADGAAHALGNLPHQDEFQGAASLAGATFAYVFNGARTVDGSNIFVASNGGIKLPNGVTTNNQYSNSTVAEEDANGNQILYGVANGVNVLQDTLGRDLPYIITSTTTDFSGCTGPLPIGAANVLNFPAYGGGSPAVIKLCAVQIPILSNFGGAQEGMGNLWFVQSVVLPDGTAWTFEYNSRSPNDPPNVNYGDLTKITFPTGGTLRYAWDNVPFCSPNPSSGLASISRAVVSRTINANDGTGDHTWQYQYAPGSPGQPIVTTVTDPLGNRAVHTFSDVSLGRLPQDPRAFSCGYYETQTQYQDSTGATLKTINTHYLATSTPAISLYDVFPDSVTTTWANGEVGEVDTTYLGVNASGGFGTTFNFEFMNKTYTAGLGNLKDEYDYDYGSGGKGPLLRHTHTDYLFESVPAYWGADFFDLINDEITYDGSGNQVALKTFGYDETPPSSSGVSAQHDSNPPNGALRGNLTSVSQWLNTTGGSITSQVNWFDTGEPYQKIDPLGHTTTFTYDSTGTYVTQTQFPDTWSPNLAHHVISGAYDFNTGLVTSFTDQNGNVSNYTYDEMRRVTSASYPDGGHTAFNYPNPNTVEQQRLQDSAAGTIVDKLVYFDGLGRQKQTQERDPLGDVFTETTYDPLGRTATVTNPHRVTGSPTDGSSTTTYDALGRVLTVTQPDRGTVQTSYNGPNQATDTDEVGNARRSTKDGLGRLIEVDEPTGGSPATMATGPVTVGSATGGEQSTQVVVTPALPGSGNVNIGGGPVQWQAVTSATTQGASSITITGLEQQNPVGKIQGTGTVTIGSSTNGEQVIPATTASGGASVSGSLQSEGTGSVTINGNEQSKSGVGATPATPGTGYVVMGSAGWQGEYGYIDVFVNGNDTNIIYGQTGAYVGCTYAYDTVAAYDMSRTATVVAQCINHYSPYVTASASGTVVNITAKSSGSNTNYSLSASTSLDPSSTGSFSQPSITAAASGGSLTGGTNANPGITVYDSGTCTVTLNGTNYNTNFGQGDTASAIASRLAPAVNGGGLVWATVSGATISFTSKTPGMSGAYSLSSSCTHNSTYFSSGSFTPSASGSTLNDGSGALFDSGTASVKVNGVTYSSNWSGSGTTPATIASGLVSALSGNSLVNASSSGGTITLTAKNSGSAGNLSVTATTTYDTTHFSSSSFALSGSPMTGGKDPFYDGGTVTLNVGGYQAPASWGQGDTATTIATKLVSYINAPNSGAPVTASSSNGVVTLTSIAPGSVGNYSLNAGVSDPDIPLYTASVTIGGSLNGSSSGSGVPPLLAAGSPLTSFVASDGSSHAFYLSANQHIWHMYWNSTASWQNQDLTLITGDIPPAANSALSSAFDSSGNSHVFYLDSAQHVHELFCCAWQDHDLTASTGNTPAAPGTALTAEVSSGNPMHLYYLGTNQHVYHLFMNASTGSWVNQDLTAATGGPLAAATSSLTNVLDSGNVTHVFYLDANQHVNQLWCCGGTTGWNNQDLTAATGNTLAAAGTALTGYSFPSGNPVHLHYLGTNQHLYHLFVNASTGAWANQDLSAITGASGSAGSGLASVANTSNGSVRVYFLDGNAHVNETYCGAGSCWTNTDMTNYLHASAAAAGSALTSFGLSAGNPVHVNYLGPNQHVNQMVFSGSGSWSNQDMTASATVIVTDSGTVTLNVDGFPATACYGVSSNSLCTGKPVNSIPAEVASALAQVLNGPGSPVTAVASGSTINITVVGSNSTSIPALSSKPDNTTLFPNGSFTSAATSFSGPPGFAVASFTATPSGSSLTGGWPNANAVDSGTMAVTVGGNTYSVPWGKADFTGSIAANLAGKIAGDPSVTATLSGNTVYLNPKQPGTTSYALSTAFTFDTTDFTSSSFTPANEVADYGTTAVTVNGHKDSTFWTAGANPSSIAQALTSQINNDSAAVVNATAVNVNATPCGTPPPSIAGNSLASFAGSDGSQHWAYFDIAKHVCSLSWTAATGYTYVDVTALTGAPAAASAGSGLAGFGDLNAGLHWAYVAGNGHLYNLAWSSSNGYTAADVTAATGANAPAAGSPVAGFADPEGDLNWAYLDANQHVNAMQWNGSAYTSGVDLTATLKAPVAVTGSPLAAFADPTGARHWAYVGSTTSGQHAYGMNWTASAGYTLAGDLTAATGAPAAVPGSALAAFASPNGGLQWAYLGANLHLYNLYQPFGGSYNYADVTASAKDVDSNNGAPVAVSGSALAAFSDANGTSYWAYLAATGHAFNFYSSTSGSYSFADITLDSGAPAAAGSPVTGFSNHGGGQEQWAYLGANNNVYQISGSVRPYAFFAMNGSSSAGIGLTATSGGLNTDYTLTSSTAFDSQAFPAASFNSTASGSALTGGANTVYQTIYDVGTVSLNIGGFTVSVQYGQQSTVASIVNALLAGIDAPGFPPPVVATLSGSTLNLSAIEPGAAGNYSLTPVSVTTQGLFAQPSFTITSASAMAGGADATPGNFSAPAVTLYTYDGLGNLTCAVQKGTDTTPFSGCASAPATWRPRSFTYDSLGRLLTAFNPETNTIQYAYDNNSNMISKTDALGVTVNFSPSDHPIDALNRVIKKAYSNGDPAVSYFYDQSSNQGLTIANGIGHLTGTTDASGSMAYSYDSMGRIRSEQRTLAGITKSMGYSYYVDGSIKTMQYPSGAVLTYKADDFSESPGGPYSTGRTVSATDTGNSINYATGATYTPAGHLASFSSGASSGFAGILNNFTYNSRLQPVSISAQSPTQTVFSINYDFHFARGDNGNVFEVENNRDSTRTQVFAYDNLNRLVSAQNTGADCTQMTANGATKYWGNSYGYDVWGNLLQKTPTKCAAENLSVTADTNNRIHTGSASDYGYDANGNMTFDATKGANYSYDGENRVKSAGGFTYTYDADDNRVEKSNGSTGTLYWYMSPGIVAESDLSGNLKSEYVFFDGARVARKDFSGNTTAVSYYFSDFLKTASVITNSLGTITEDEDYYPWGAELQFVNNDSNHYKFGGHERDTETQLDYFGARYYGNWTGRFLTPDYAARPVSVPYANFGNPQSLNLYRFAQNNPTTFGDPDGHCIPFCFALAGGGALGGAALASNPVGWTILGVAAVGTIVYLTYDHYHRSSNNTPPPPPAGNAGSSSGAQATSPPPPGQPQNRQRGTNKRGQKNSRPSGYRKGHAQKVYSEAKDGPTGGKMCSTCDTEIHWDGESKPRPFHIDHAGEEGKWAERTLPDDSTRKDWLDLFHQGTRIRCIACNLADNQLAPAPEQQVDPIIEPPAPDPLPQVPVTPVPEDVTNYDSGDATKPPGV
jgi:RHS repeat-associated protein